MRAALPPVLLSLALVATGCIGLTAPEASPGQAVDGPDGEWARRALPFGGSHDHTDPDQHRNLSTANFELLGYDPLITDHHGRTSGSFLCDSTKEHEGRRLSVTHSIYSDVAFVVADTTDPANPEKIGELVMPSVTVYDLDLSPDLQYVVLGTAQPDDDVDGAPTDAEPRPVYFRDACTGEKRKVAELPADAPWAHGVVLVDLSDPRDPRIVDYRPTPGTPVSSAHSVQVQEVDGTTFVTATIFDLTQYTSYYRFYEIAETPAGTALELLSHYQILDAEMPTTDYWQALGAHDGMIQEHPVTGDTLAWLAYGPKGMVLLDMSDPRNPQEIARWDDWGRIGAEGGGMIGHYAHSILPVETTWDGRHVTFVGEECLTQPAEAPSCFVVALDTTDPADPGYLGYWTLPHMVSWDVQLQFSLHYPAVHDRTLFVSAYHGGLWAVDVSTPEKLETMPSVGVWLPVRESPKPAEPGSGFDASRPSLHEPQIAADGTIVVTDASTGLYTGRFHASRPAPAVLPWEG